jgi:hypothetical protein
MTGIMTANMMAVALNSIIASAEAMGPSGLMIPLVNTIFS